MQPTQPLQRSLRRLALTTKQVGKGYYKGTGTGSMGSHTKWGGYIIDYNKVRTYKVPDLTDFTLTPFVVTRVEKPDGRGKFSGSQGPMDGKAYLERWKEYGGVA
ncbi:60S ribosomal protein L27, mitochondrial [Taxawa tesnikishii (nom. ined.)]|nr:60S ribosomal protein L27, mitochondrial [Dothideales sp. JES 119]